MGNDRLDLVILTRQLFRFGIFQLTLYFNDDL